MFYFYLGEVKMNREEYNKNRPRIQCDVCGKLITKANYNRHHETCLKGGCKKLKITHKFEDKLICEFCGKQCKNLISLAQHEARCAQNPNRKDYNKLAKFSIDNFRGQSKYTSDIIYKQSLKLKQMYKDGELVSRLNNDSVTDYVYKEHNNSELLKWAEYINSLDVVISPHRLIREMHDGYQMVSMLDTTSNGAEPEHIWMIKQVMGVSTLPHGWEIHHIDRDRSNNSIYNLIPFETGSEHKRYHKSKYAWLIYDSNKHCFNCIVKKPCDS